MRKNVILFLISATFPFSAKAQVSIKQLQELGSLAGVVMACRAPKQLYQFEEILSRYISNTVPSKAVEEDAIRTYAYAKVQSYKLQITRSKRGCSDVLSDFSKMDLLRFQLYTDGSLKTTDGKFLYPRGQKGLAPNAERVY